MLTNLKLNLTFPELPRNKFNETMWQPICMKSIIKELAGNKPKGRISKRVFQENKVR